MAERQGTILIVDDEAPVRRVLHQRLAAEGYCCDEAGDGAEALSKMSLNLAELVILDIKMPGKSGLELLPEIRFSYPDTAVVMATAVADADIAIQCMRQGAYDYITKPFKLDEVIINIERALEKRRLELENRDYQLHLEQKVEEQADKSRTSFLNATTALAYALEAKDMYTSGHSQRVTQIAVSIAQELNMSPDSISKIQLAGQVRNIGKIGVKESVLNKSSGLTEEEFQHIRDHCEIGERILSPVVDEEILKVVRHRHERYDGGGYPDGLEGECIPLGARILAVADTFDAITSDRPYRCAMSIEEARSEIKKCAAIQFDPVVVAAFLKISVPEILMQKCEIS